MKLTFLLLVALFAGVSIAALFGVIQKIFVCGSKEHKLMVYNILSDYMFSGKIPFKEAVNIVKAQGTNQEKYEMIKNMLINNNLQPLPPCKN